MIRDHDVSFFPICDRINLFSVDHHIKVFIPVRIGHMLQASSYADITPIPIVITFINFGNTLNESPGNPEAVHEEFTDEDFRTLLFRVPNVPGLRCHCFSLRYDMRPREAETETESMSQTE